MQTSIKERKGIVQDIKNLTKEPSLLIIILITFAWFGLFIIYPFAKITLLPEKSHWVSAFTDKRLLEAFWHTILSSTLSTATATILGFIYAYTLNYTRVPRSEEHTSELQSRQYLVCRLLLEKKKKNN